ncbi:ATP-dependent protease LonB [Clostridium tetani]|uniref:endopeptidase La n=1 Tax=Clostridium tetani TaxID=1513 RepID=A0A4Q0VDT8_CLOTA|nr:ATP-dependent protease LonB [Clostridium tetani]RXI48908.1 ATP-dependent protease LonB [Clostridium tetani]
MTEVFMFVQFIITIIMGLYFFNALKGQKTNKITIDKESKKEIDTLNKLRSIKLTQPLTEKSRPNSFAEIIGQDKGIMALKAALCGPNPQHVIIYGPPGIGKTAAARLVLEYAKKNTSSPFKEEAKFIEIDATTIRFDDRGIADPLIGSVHDPIYQGAGPLGVAGIPQPKAGAVTKAHGGVLFIDEIGELHPTIMNKLLKVLEDRKVFLDSAYYNSSDPNVPSYIRDIFDNGFPADFRLVGATTRNPEEITPALRSRCVEIFFRGLLSEEIQEICKKSVEKIGFTLEKSACDMIGLYASNGREAINLLQLASGIALNEDRKKIIKSDIEWVVENGNYHPKVEIKVAKEPKIGLVNGLGVYGSNIGAVMPIEITAIKNSFGRGKVNVAGIIEQEQMGGNGRSVQRKSSARCSVENVCAVLKSVFNIQLENYDVHINFLGGIPIDGPSAGISIAIGIYSAINLIPIDNMVAMTGEISLYGDVKAVGGVNSKIEAAKKAGAKKVLIPKENWQESYESIESIQVIPINNIMEAIEVALIEKHVKKSEEKLSSNIFKSNETLSANSINS